MSEKQINSKSDDTNITTDGYLDFATAEKRLKQLIFNLEAAGGNFDTVFIINRVNQYYYCGTMQDAVLVWRKDSGFRLFVRKSWQRACEESPLQKIVPIGSYRDMLKHLPEDLGNVYLETEKIPLAMLARIQRVFKLGQILPLDRFIMSQRMVKDDQELALMRESGAQHNRLLREIVPGLLREGMSEVDLMADIYAAMIRQGHHGVSRFGMFQIDMVGGQLAFGENSLYPTSFDGPGGMRGMSPAVPVIGSRERLLKKGDLVFVDIAYGVAGYHTDKTQVYSFGSEVADQVSALHAACRQVLDRTAGMLRAGQIPADIYQKIRGDLPLPLQEHFMGYGQEQVRFIGHGIGLEVDEPPAISAGFREPLHENMVIALEPKSGIAGIGMVGVEETYVIGADGSSCITGGSSDILVV